jgi:hypothetical protein
LFNESRTDCRHSSIPAAPPEPFQRVVQQKYPKPAPAATNPHTSCVTAWAFTLGVTPRTCHFETSNKSNPTFTPNFTVPITNGTSG